MQRDWKLAVVAACRHQRWQEATAHAANARLSRDDWRKVLEYIDSEKVRVIERQIVEWRERTGR